MDSSWMNFGWSFLVGPALDGPTLIVSPFCGSTWFGRISWINFQLGQLFVVNFGRDKCLQVTLRKLWLSFW